MVLGIASTISSSPTWRGSSVPTLPTYEATLDCSLQLSVTAAVWQSTGVPDVPV